MYTRARFARCKHLSYNECRRLVREETKWYKRGLWIRNLVVPSEQFLIGSYLSHLRWIEYFESHGSKNCIYILLHIWHRWQYRKLKIKLGLCIPPFVCDYGLIIRHFGSIIINPHSTIGRNCQLYPGVLIGLNEKGVPHIGNNVTICAGVKIVGDVSIGDNVVIAPNSVVTHNVPDNVLVGGVPAKIIKTYE